MEWLISGLFILGVILGRQLILLPPVRLIAYSEGSIHVRDGILYRQILLFMRYYLSSLEVHMNRILTQIGMFAISMAIMYFTHSDWLGLLVYFILNAADTEQRLQVKPHSAVATEPDQVLPQTAQSSQAKL